MSSHSETIRDMPKRKLPDASKSSEKKKPNRSGRPIMVWVATEVGEALDRFSAAQKFTPTMTDIVELALREFLKAEGFPPGLPSKS
jgi:hypothetical protein